MKGGREEEWQKEEEEEVARQAHGQGQEDRGERWGGIEIYTEGVGENDSRPDRTRAIQKKVGKEGEVERRK